MPLYPFSLDDGNARLGIRRKLPKKKWRSLLSICGFACIFAASMNQFNVMTRNSSKVRLYERLLRMFHASEELQDYIDNEVELGWESPPAEWLKDLCPEVVEHFTHFPSAKKTAPEDVEFLPFMPTEHAAQVVCTMKVLKRILASINAQIYLHAGSHLGAIIHGQVIPWDDDLDAIMDFRKMDELYQICKGDGVEVHPSGVMLRCYKYSNAIKVWLHPEGFEKMTNKGAKWYSPFVDLFAYKYEDDVIWEVDPRGNKAEQNYNVFDYFPTRPFYFGGIYLLGPQAQISESRYNLEKCIMAKYNHRIEAGVKHMGTNIINPLDCDKLSNKFPFKEKALEMLSLKNGPFVAELFPTKAADMSTVLVAPLSVEQRKEWYNSPDSDGQKLTDALENINKVEIDNSISPQKQCTGSLKVVEFNAKRGRWWMESVNLLKDADVIILNEMDIGMARSDNQHTTRLMAHLLGMNYAWGLEFVELTPGTGEDRSNANGLQDYQGLHGNAFLTKCKISKPVIFRDQIGQYFSSESTPVNAGGEEKRLGGRMGMFGRIIVDGRETVIGSAHKLDGFREEVKEYIGKRDAIVAGDQHASFCMDVNLSNIVSGEGGAAMHHTWPASCSSLGNHRGDNICSNMKMVGEEVTMMPCVTEFGFSTKLGDHALTSAVLAGN